MQIWSFETLKCLNFSMQRQKRHDITNDVKVYFLICGFARWMKNMLFLARLLFIILSMCAMEVLEKLTLINFCLQFSWRENDWPYAYTLKILPVAKIKLFFTDQGAYACM